MWSIQGRKDQVTKQSNSLIFSDKSCRYKTKPMCGAGFENSNNTEKNKMNMKTPTLLTRVWFCSTITITVNIFL